MDELDKKIIRAVQTGLPLCRKPYEKIAKDLDVTESQVIGRLRLMKEYGEIRKMGAVLKHRAAGFQTNCLCAWRVPAERLEEVAKLMCESPAVSHCYDRVTTENWPYNLYTMVHSHSRTECEEIVEKLASQAGLGNSDRVMMYTVKEYKKTSMKYFCE